jgi:phosphatidylinositol 4-kinase
MIRFGNFYFCLEMDEDERISDSSPSNSEYQSTYSLKIDIPKVPEQDLGELVDSSTRSSIYRNSPSLRLRTKSPSSITGVDATQTAFASKKSWLLRLFQSDFFDAWIALSYLFKYPDLGIQEYLCSRMKYFPISEIEFLIPQLCHLLIIRPKTSSSIENFMLEICQVSMHFAVMMTWLLEGYLNDLRDSKNYESFYICSRVYSKCQTILYNLEADVIDGQPIFMYPYHKMKVKEHVKPAILGLSYIGYSFAFPELMECGKRMALMHGRQNFPRVQTASSPKDSPAQTRRDSGPKSPTNKLTFRIAKKIPSLEDMFRGNAFSYEQYMDKNKPRKSFGSAASMKSPVSSKKSPMSPTKVDRPVHSGYFFHSEIQFITMLVDISARLVALPRPARQQMLQAELSLLNHNLPADVCLPFWCNATAENPRHHKLARISPVDAVTLNSADRVLFK